MSIWQGLVFTLALIPGIAFAQDTARSDGAVLRGLDKVTSETVDIDLEIGEARDLGRLTIRLGECRYPAADPNADAYAQLIITNRQTGKTMFDGWMIASAPALSALDDARYDVWLISCHNS